MTILEKYSKQELIHIVDMYDINMKIEDLKKSKVDILKMMKIKKAHEIKDLPNKSEIKPMVEKDKKNKNSLITKVTAHKALKNKIGKKLKDFSADEKKEYNKLAKRESKKSTY